VGDVNLDAVFLGGTTDFSGKISGPGAINKINAGTVIISGAAISNTFSGGTTVSTGTLVLAKPAGFRVLGSGSTTIFDGAILRTDAANQWGTAAVPPLITINGTGILDVNNNDQKIGLSSASSNALLNLGSATVTVDRNASNSFAGKHNWKR
jgi:autotransporter-associated beta strand protein